MVYLKKSGKFIFIMMSFILAIDLFLSSVEPMEASDENNGPEDSTEDQDLWKNVNSLSTIVSYMNTGAHPDDENSALLAYMSLGKGVQSSTVIANRGSGGQNEIGSELGDGLSVIRTRELQEASKYTDNNLAILNQGFDDSITDFGFSKSPEETLEYWGEEKTYRRLIKEIRKERPDILFTSFRDVENTHGHHRAMSILTQRAYDDAGDPEVFPEQLEDDLDVWQPRKLYLPANNEENETLRFNIGGEKDPVFEKTYPQLGQEARYFHESQGMGRDLPVEDHYESLELAGSTVGKEEETIFDSIPYDFAEYADLIENEELNNKLENFQEDLNEIVSLYPNRDDIVEKTQEVIETDRKLIDELENEQFGLSDSKRNDLLDRLETKESQIQDTSFEASDLNIKLDPEDNQLVRGEETEMSVVVENKGEKTVSEMEISPLVPKEWEVNVEDIDPIEPGDTATSTLDITVDKKADYFDPYEEPVVQAKVSYEVMGTEIEQTNSPNIEDNVAVLPEFGIELSPENAVVNTEKKEQQIDVDIDITNYVDGPNEGTVQLEVPENWNVEPQETDVSFTEQGEEKTVSLRVSLTEKVDSGDFSMKAIVENDEGEISESYHPIDYDHIGKTYWPKGDAKVDITAFPLNISDNLKVGYVDSGFDNVPEALQRVGMDITKLTSEDLESEDLSKYDTIAVGIRAYLSREDLIENNDNLLDYVKSGGHVVMQYHKPGDNWDTENTAPFKLEIGSPSIEWRVTDKDSDIDLLKPKSPLFNQPNKIEDSDWDNWVQERGLYFPMNWDNRFDTYISMSDKKEFPFNGPFDSGILMSHYGEGSYLYTNLGWYRQIKNNVPGGYRTFTNLLEYPLREVNSENISTLVNRYQKEGEFNSDEIAHELKLHLKAVEHFEKKGQDDKIIKHMNGFKKLIEYKHNNKLISQKAFTHLREEANKLIEN